MEVKAEPARDEQLELTEPKPILKGKEAGLANIRKIDDSLLMQSAATLADSLSFRDIVPGQKKPPKEWVAELGAEEAEKRLRVANAAWLNAKEAPAGIKVAAQIYTGILKARATENQPVAQINVGAIQFGPPEKPERLPVKVVETDGY